MIPFLGGFGGAVNCLIRDCFSFGFGGAVNFLTTPRLLLAPYSQAKLVTTKMGPNNKKSSRPSRKAWKNPNWHQSNISGLQIKGETKYQIEHAAAGFKNQKDTSVDAPWRVNRFWSFSDFYMFSVLAVFATPLLLVWPFMLGACAPPVLLNYLYITTCIEPETNTIPHSSMSWKFHCLIQFFLSLPAQILAILTLAYSRSIMTCCGLLYLITTSVFRYRWPTERLWYNLKVIKPHGKGPSLYHHFEDCVAAVAGSVYRQGFFEFICPFVNMLLFNPWIKYWITGNIYMDCLDERFITQIGQSLEDVGLRGVCIHVQKAISRTKPDCQNRNEIDRKSFAPHYPYPPHRRRWAVGMQHGSLTTTFVHTTHYQSPEICHEGEIASRSHSCARPIYRVMLWRNNPYHIFTGYVEANISNGKPSQRKKKFGLEHPMWLVNSHNKLSASRDTIFSLGRIDAFFDNFIPKLNHYIRLNTLGREAADAALLEDPHQGFELSKTSLCSDEVW